MRSIDQRQLDRLKARLDTIPQSVRDAVKPQLAASSDALVSEMKRLCPVESGGLRDSIRVEPGKLETQFTIKAGSPEVPYAAMVEFGTSKMTARPFFLPAYRGLRLGIIGQLKMAVLNAVKEERS